MELINRLNNVIRQDKKVNPQYITEVIKSDIFYLLNNYFEVEYEDVDVDINVDNNNFYKILIYAKGDRIKTMQVLPR